MEVAKQITGRKTSYFFAFLYIVLLTFLGGLYFSVTALCSGLNSLVIAFYEIKCSRLAFIKRSCLNEAGNYPAAGCAIGANTGK